MRITLGGVAATVLILFYLGVYRPTRSSFSGWWSVALLCAGASTSLLLLNGSSAQALALSASNVLSVVGVTGTWFAMRTLHRGRLPLWLLVVAPAVMLIPTWLQDPATNIWAGNGPLFVYMGVVFAAGAVEMWLAWWTRRKLAIGELNNAALVAYLVTALAATLIGFFYLLRGVLFFIVGPDSETFGTFAGTGPTTGVLIVNLVAVTFSVSAVSWDQQTQELRRRAAQDDLTGLLARTEFRTQAERLLQDGSRRGVPVMLVMADLDHFKRVNDEHGHDAGDRVLLHFAALLKELLAPEEVVGRLGGEEFGLVLLGDEEDVRARLTALSEGLAARSPGSRFAFPTVSYGLAACEPGDTIPAMFVRADFALYLAKTEGRNRAVMFLAEQGHDQMLNQRRHLRDGRRTH